MANTPNNQIPELPENVVDPAAATNLALDVIDALLQTAVINMDQTAPPGTPADGDLHIVSAGATGDWAGQDNNMARWVDDPGYWQFYAAGTQVKIILNNADGVLYIWNGAQWAAASGVPAAQGTSGQWVYQTNTAIADPGSGNIRTDDTPALSTALAISNITDQGVDASRVIKTLSSGDVLFAQQADNSDNWGRFNVTGAPVDNSTWFEIPVTFVSGGGTVSKGTDMIIWIQWAT